MSLERSAPQPLLSNWEGLAHSAEPLRQAQCGAGVSTAQRTSFLPKVIYLTLTTPRTLVGLSRFSCVRLCATP